MSDEAAPPGAALPVLQARGLRIEPALYLAPMEGVTDPSFRGLVIDTCPGALGAACTEFLRVTQQPLPTWKLAEELGPHRRGVAVGVQLMGNEPAMIAATAARAAETHAAFVDLNFGCPAPRVFQHCAGSALLDDPPLLEAVVRAVVEACPLPVTAKIRAGVSDDGNLEEIARRVEGAGAALLSVHGRLRIDSYRKPTDWSRIRRAKQAVSIPVIGNGSAESAAGIDAMFAETGCDAVMIGRGAIADPWLPARWLARRRGEPEPQPDRAEVLTWLQEYAARMRAGGATPHQALGRLKQSAKAMRGGYLEVVEVTAALREKDEDGFLARLQSG